jgi:hypothetical protein
MAILKYKNPATGAWETMDALPAIGQTVEITATELTGKNTADRVAMYAAGTRLLKVVNGDTEVLLGLDADGSTEWLGSNKPLNNLLDNSDFTNPVNQRGQSSYTASGYTIDRWAIDTWSGNPLAINSGYIAIGENIDTKQYLSDTTMGGKTYTCAAKILNQAIPLCGSGTMPTENGGIIKVKIEGGFELRLQKFDNGYCGVDLFAQPGNTINVEWAALYEGSYTADTLPPYTPKGYAAELAECQRYYVKLKNSRSGYQPFAIGVGNGYNQGVFNIQTPVQMRSFTTVSYNNLRIVGKGCEYVPVKSITPADIVGNSTTALVTVDSPAYIQNAEVYQISGNAIGSIELSADL